MLIALGLLGLCILAAIICFILYYYQYKCQIQDIQKLDAKFKRFFLTRADLKRFYHINPNKWRYDKYSWCPYYYLEHDSWGQQYHFYTSFWDHLWMQYKRITTKHKRERKKASKIEDQYLKEFLANVQGDIDVIRESAQKQIDYAKEINKKIQLRLDNEKEE